MIHRAAIFLILGLLILSPQKQLAPAQVRTAYSAYQVAAGQETEIVVILEGARDVYGIDVAARYDPALLEVVDADPGRVGVQVVEGTFPQPEFVALNSANPQTGEIRYAVTQLNPTPPASGSGTIFAVRVRGLGVAGNSQFQILSVEMSSRDGVLLPVQWETATIEAAGDNRQPGAGQPTGVAIAPPTVAVSTATATGTLEVSAEATVAPQDVVQSTETPSVATIITTEPAGVANPTEDNAVAPTTVATTIDVPPSESEPEQPTPSSPSSIPPVASAVAGHATEIADHTENSAASLSETVTPSPTSAPASVGAATDTSADALAVIGDESQMAEVDAALPADVPSNDRPTGAIVLLAAIAVAGIALILWLLRTR